MASFIGYCLHVIHATLSPIDVMSCVNIIYFIMGGFFFGFFSELISINSIFQFLLATFSLIFDDQSRNICLSSIFCGFYFFFVLSFSFHSLALYFGRGKHVNYNKMFNYILLCMVTLLKIRIFKLTCKYIM